MNKQTNVPAKIFLRNSTVDNYLKQVSQQQFSKDHFFIQKSLANNGIIKDAVNKLKNINN